MSVKEFHLALVDDSVDDRKRIFNKLVEVFKTRERTVQISSFPDAFSYFLSIEKGMHYDLTFLDIDMPDVDGITLAKKLLAMGRKERIIYVSNREDLVFDSLETKPFGFVRKNLFEKDIDKAIELYFRTLKEEGKNVFLLVSEGEHIRLSIEDIVYIESQGKKQVFHTLDSKKTHETLLTMKEIQDSLADKGFLECYKGILVNFRHIKAILKDSVVLKDGTSLPLARRKANDVLKEYLFLMQDRIQNIF